MEKKIEKLELEVLEPRIAPAGMPAPEAFCAGGVYHSPQFQGIRFIQDPCNYAHNGEALHSISAAS